MDGSNTTPKLFACGRFSCVSNVLICKIIGCEVPSSKHEIILREEWAAAQQMGIDFSTVQFGKLLLNEDPDSRWHDAAI